MLSPDEKQALAVNGEIYNHRAIRQSFERDVESRRNPVV
ncbi:MAG: hypothetical protein MI741_03825 [Rhodospirillales bacterium]|nr:hypothetical protein [Rhodospirillales bacterium]